MSETLFQTGARQLSPSCAQTAGKFASFAPQGVPAFIPSPVPASGIGASDLLSLPCSPMGSAAFHGKFPGDSFTWILY